MDLYSGKPGGSPATTGATATPAPAPGGKAHGSDQYTRPDGTTGTKGDGGDGDPGAAYAGSPYQGEDDIANPETGYGGDFLYGRTANFAADRANQEAGMAWQLYDKFNGAADQAVNTGNTANATDQVYGSQLWNRGATSLYGADQQTTQQLAMADQLGGAGGQSAAQAQLQQGLNASEASNLALARSGRGWGQSGAALGQAIDQNAAAGQNAANTSALLRFQGQQAAAGIYGQAAGRSQQAGLAQQQQGVSAVQAGFGSQFQGEQLGANIAQTGAGEYFAGEDAQKAWIDAQHNADYQREALGMQQYGIESGADTAANALQEQQDSRIGGYIGAGVGAVGGFFAGGPAGSTIGATTGYGMGSQVSDTDAKKDKAEAAGFAKGVQAVAAQTQGPSTAQRFGNAMVSASGRPNPFDTSNLRGVQIGQALASRRATSAAAGGTAAGRSANAAASAAGRPGAINASRPGVNAGDGPQLGALPIRTDLGTPGVDVAPLAGMTPATTTNAWDERAAGIRNPEMVGSYLPPGAGPVDPNSPNWLDQYMAQQGSDTEMKRDKERAAGFAEAMRSIDSDQSEFASPHTYGGVDIDALDAAQRRQGGPVNDMRPAVGYTYQYKDPTEPGAKAGHVAGPMAHDIEHTIAADAVETGPDGRKMVNPGRLTLHNTAAIGEQQTELEKLKAQLDALAGKKPAAARAATRMPTIPQLNPGTLRRAVPTASYPASENVPVTGEEENFKIPLGWDPDVDEAAARQITFPGEPRTNVVYQPRTY